MQGFAKRSCRPKVLGPVSILQLNLVAYVIVHLWLFAIYMGKPVGPQFRQIVSKIQDLEISSRNRFTVCTNQFRSLKNDREAGIKDNF